MRKRQRVECSPRACGVPRAEHVVPHFPDWRAPEPDALPSASGERWCETGPRLSWPERRWRALWRRIACCPVVPPSRRARRRVCPSAPAPRPRACTSPRAVCPVPRGPAATDIAACLDVRSSARESFSLHPECRCSFGRFRAPQSGVGRIPGTAVRSRTVRSSRYRIEAKGAVPRPAASRASGQGRGCSFQAKGRATCSTGATPRGCRCA